MRKLGGVLPDFAQIHLGPRAGALAESLPALQRTLSVAASAAAGKIRPWISEAAKLLLATLRKPRG
jgi:hypothetical protein